MAELRPFPAVRPAPDKVHLVASRSYVTYTPLKLRDKLEYNPYSFIHIINPEYREKRKTRPNSPERFKKVKKRYDEFLQEQTLIREDRPAYYIYRQLHAGHSHTGIIAAVAVDDYLQGHIRIHEQTIGPREEVFREYLDCTDFNAEPVLLTFPDYESLHELILPWTTSSPLYDFSTADRVRHQLWAVQEEAKIEAIGEFFAHVPLLYIADGHHRSASSVRLAEERRKKEHDPQAAWNYFMAYILPSRDLLIHPFHRLVTEIGHYRSEDFLRALEKDFEINKLQSGAAPDERRSFHLYLEDSWYKLSFRHPGNIHLEETDAQLLTDTVLKPLLGIEDLRHDSRVSFLGGENRIQELENLVNKGVYKAAFALYPVSIGELIALSDRHISMPPKSTYIEPKLRSGLTIFELNRAE